MPLASGGRLVRFCADTGCSVNIMPAKIAASNGLKWREPDCDEPSYKSVTNEDLTIVGQTSAYVKLHDFKTPHWSGWSSWSVLMRAMRPFSV